MNHRNKPKIISQSVSLHKKGENTHLITLSINKQLNEFNEGRHGKTKAKKGKITRKARFKDTLFSLS